MIDSKHVRSRALWTVSCLVAAVSLVPNPAAAGGATTTALLDSTADTYVDETYPDASCPPDPQEPCFGQQLSMWVDATPAKQAFLRFDVPDLGGREILDARLRMYQTDSSDSGGRVFSISSNGWPESITWNTRPAIDGSLLGSFGAVASGELYELDLGTAVAGEGPLSLAIDSTSSNGARWSTRERAGLAPQLILELESADESLQEVADPITGSSEPTYFSTQRRVAVTSAGRLLAVHGLHGSGVQLAWRDGAGGDWRTDTTGDVADGALLEGTGTGDWPASIALARDSAGEQHAWVVFARDRFGSMRRPVYLRRLSDLDAPSGPTVGPLVEIDAPDEGATMADVAFIREPGGVTRGVVLWSRLTSATEYELVAGWITDLDTDTPEVHHAKPIDSETGLRWGTLVTAKRGMHVIARSDGERLSLFRHSKGAPLRAWRRIDRGMPAEGHPSAVGLDTGAILSVAETDLDADVVKVQRYSPTGRSRRPELTLSGYSMPSIATDGKRAWVVAVRESDGFVVSRRYTPRSGWSATDRVEIGPEGGGFYDFPNLVRQANDRLRFVVGGRGPDVRSSVLAFERGL